MRLAIARIVKQKNKMKEQAGELVTCYPAYLYSLFYAFGLYLVLPLFDIPLLGLSISAPLFFVIAATVIFKPLRHWFNEHRGWIILSLTIWLAVALSTIINEMLPGGTFNRTGMISLVQYAYWLLVFVICCYLFRDVEIRKKISNIFALAIFVLVCLRCYEALFEGKIGAWAGTRFMTENGYGFHFSVFSPFLFLRSVDKEVKKKWFWIFATILLLGAVAINGSRGSWVAIAIGVCFSIVTFIAIDRRNATNALLVLAVLFCVGYIVMSLSPTISKAVNDRFQTLTSLEEDKTYVVRKVLVKKGLTLFRESPLIGVGSARFAQEKVEMELPELLQYVDREAISKKSSHNSYIQFLAEFGLIGAIPFSILLIYIFVRGLLISFKTIDDRFDYLRYFIAFLQMSVHMYVISSITGSLAWVIYGSVVGFIIDHDHKRLKLT